MKAASIQPKAFAISQIAHVILLFTLFGCQGPDGYVGYTAPLLPPVFKTCVKDYSHPSFGPSHKRLIAFAKKLIATGHITSFSFYHFNVQYNNANGNVPIPAGHVIVGKVSRSWIRQYPCGAVPRIRQRPDYYEKFRNISAAVADIDVQMDITWCESVMYVTKQIELAIMPDPAPNVAIPTGEHAVIIPMSQAHKNAFQQSATLRLQWKWQYDNCNIPRRTFSGKTHSLLFDSMTFDPARGGVRTWRLPGAPVHYQSKR